MIDSKIQLELTPIKQTDSWLQTVLFGTNVDGGQLGP